MTSQTCVQGVLCPAQKPVPYAGSEEEKRNLTAGLSIIALVVIAVALAAWLSRPKVESLAAVVEYRPAVGSFAATAPLIRGYNMPVSMSAELWSVIKGRSGFNVYEGRTYTAASTASAAVEYRPAAGSFAATAPLIRGYNMPVSLSTELWSVINGREGFNVYEGKTPALAPRASAVLHYPVEGSFSGTAPLVPGYNMPASLSAELWGVITGRAGFDFYQGQTLAAASETQAVLHRPVEGGFAGTAPLIPGYTVPHNIPLDLWGVITGRDGFNVYEGR
jgi:hypothetical protein